MTEAYPLSWPHGWPRTAAGKRTRAKFHVKHERSAQRPDGSYSSWSEKGELTIAAAMRRVNDELARLGARGVIVSTNVELRRDGQPRSDRRAPDDPGVAVYFRLGGKDRVLACDKWDRVPGNIAAIAGHIDAIRRQDRYGVGTLDQAFAGYAALPPPSKERPWRDVLGLHREIVITASMVEDRYRSLARERHPDTGGTDAMMAELNSARAAARKELGEGVR